MTSPLAPARRRAVAPWLALAALALASPAAAQEPLTVSAAVQRALAAQPGVQAAASRRAEARESLGAARADHGPVLRGTLAGTAYGEPVPVTPIHGFGPGELPDFDDTLVQAGVQVSYVLLDSGARRARIAQAGAQVDAAAAALTAAEQVTAARVVAVYARVLAAQRTLAGRRARGEALDRERTRVRQLLAVGRAAELDRLRAEAALATAEADTVRAASALDLAERELARLLGLDPEAARASRLVPLADAEAGAAERAALAERAASSSPAVAQARAAIAAATAARELARSAYFPRLQTTAALQELAGGELEFASEWNAGLQLSVPLWDGGATGRRVARAAAAVDTARAQLAQAELDARSAVDSALAAIAEARARGAALARAEERIAEVVRVQKLLVEVGSGTQVDYLNAEAELADARAALAESAAAVATARTELARATGELSLDWLARNLEASR